MIKCVCAHHKMNRNSHQRCSVRLGVLRNFTKFTGKHLCQSLFFNKAAGLRTATLLKKGLWHRCFPVNFVEFLRTPFSQKSSGRLLPNEVTYLKLLKTPGLNFFGNSVPKNEVSFLECFFDRELWSFQQFSVTTISDKMFKYSAL